MIKKTLLSLTLVVSSSTAFAGGIPVIDTTSLSQSAANFAKQMIELKNQVENQIKQITELKNQVAAMTGSRNLANLARETIDQAIPESWKDIYNMKDIDLGSLQSGRGFDPEGGIKALNNMVSQVEGIMKNTLQRQDTIQRLMAEVDLTQDIKASADLQNRIAAEQTSLANNQMQVDQLYKAYELQKEIHAQKSAAYQTCLAWRKVDGRSCN